MRIFKVSETVNFIKEIEANNKEEAINIFISLMNDLVFGEDCKEFKDISCGVTIKELYK